MWGHGGDVLFFIFFLNSTRHELALYGILLKTNGKWTTISSLCRTLFVCEEDTIKNQHYSEKLLKV